MTLTQHSFSGSLKRETTNIQNKKMNFFFTLSKRFLDHVVLFWDEKEKGDMKKEKVIQNSLLKFQL
jgi:hypothetical protein